MSRLPELISVIRPCVGLLLASVCWFGCGSSLPDDEFTLSLVVLHDTQFGEPAATYEFRSDSMETMEAGEIPLVFSGGSVPPSQAWEVVTVLPRGDDYRVALAATMEESFVRCTGAADFSVPPRLLHVALDCRSNPTGPPAGVELGPTVIYIVGNVEAE